MQLSNKQTDPTYAFNENERQISESHWAIRIVKPVSKNPKLSAFLTKTAQIKLAKEITTRHSIEWFFIDYINDSSISKFIEETD